MPGLDGIGRVAGSREPGDPRIQSSSRLALRNIEAAALGAGRAKQLRSRSTSPRFSNHPAVPTGLADLSAIPCGADLLVQLLGDTGVDVVFGLPGGAISPVRCVARYADPLGDDAARNGACSQRRLRARKLASLRGVAVTSGPGMLNARTGLASAWCDGLPVLLLVGEVPHGVQGKGVLQDGSAYGLQLIEMARYVSKFAVEVPRPSALPHLVRRAIATAMSGRRGPVVLTLPMDVTTAQM